MAEQESDERATDTDTGRVLALSDGVFAIAGTLLVLDLKLPPGLHGEAQLTQALDALVPEVRAYALSYLLIGTFWLAHHRQFRLMRRVRSSVARLNLLLLGVITLLPFSTAVLSGYGSERGAVALYAANIVAIFVVEVAIGTQVLRHRDNRAGSLREARVTLVLRPAVGAVVFAVSIPVALGLGANAGFTVWPFLVVTWFTRVLVDRLTRSRDIEQSSEDARDGEKTVDTP